jgi:hypothetical protein
MLDFLSPVQWGIVAAALAAVAGIYVPWGSFKFPSFGGSAEPDPDSADLAALKRLNVRYKDCPEGKAALKVLATHFLDHSGDAA